MGVVVAVERSMQVRLDMLVDGYLKNAQRASGATLQIATAAEAPRSALQSVSRAAADVGQGLVAAAGIGATSMAAWTASAVTAGAAYNSLQQTAGSALETLLGSTEAATAQMEELAAFARTSPFPRQMWIQAQQQLIGFGVEAEKIIPIFQALQDGVVAVGGSAQSIEEVVLILAKISSVGAVTAEDLNELGVRGIDAARLVGEAWGMTSAEVRESMSQGAIDATAFIDTLVEEMSTRYAGAAEGLRETWVGALDRIAGATRDVGAVLTEPFIDPQGGGAGVQWANDMADAIRALEATLGPVMTVFESQASPAFDAASRAAQRFAAALREADLVGMLEQLDDAAPVLAAFGAAAAAAGSASALSALGFTSLAGAVSPVTAGLVALAVTSPEVREALMGIFQSLAPLAGPATDLAVELAALAANGVEFAGSIISVLVPALSAVIAIATPVVQLASSIAGVMAEIPGPVLAAAAGLIGLARALMMIRSLTGALTIGGALVGALDQVESRAKSASSAVGGLAGALRIVAGGAIIAGVIALMTAWDDTAEKLEKVRSVTSSGLITDLERLSRTGEASAGLARLFGEGADAADGMSDKLRILNNDWKDLEWWDTSGNERDAAAESLRTLDQAMADMVASGEDADQVLRDIVNAYDLTDAEIEQLLDRLPQYTAETERQNKANQEGAGAAAAHADGLAGLESQAEATRVSIQSLAEEMRAQVDPAFAAVKAMVDLRDAEEQYQAAIDEFGATSDEARGALLEMLEAQAEAISTGSELAELTGGEISPELLALAEAAGLSGEELDWLIDQINEAQGAGEEYANTIADVNADLTESGGRVQARMGLVYAGMTESAANWVVNTKGAIDELMAAGWTYEEALEEVARRSGVSTDFIENGFVEAREKGLEFSDDYPATIRLNGVDNVIDQAQRVQRWLDSIDRTVTISFKHQGFLPTDGVSIPGMSEGGPVEGPHGAGDVVPRMLQPGEHVLTVDEVQAMGGHRGVESIRAAALSGQTAFAQSGSYPVMSAASPMSMGPLTATAVIDLGRGITQRIRLEFEDHDRDLKRRVQMGSGRSR